MIFRRSANHRRAERTSTLDVRSRAEPARRSRRRLVMLALLAAMGAVATAYFGAQAWAWGRQQLLDSGLFAVNTIEIFTEGNWVAAEQVRQWAGVREGDNLLAVDMPRIRRDLELIPQIQSASVERVLPHLLRLRIAEREPLAQIKALQAESDGAFAPTTYYLDAAGVVMPPLPAGRSTSAFSQALEALPIVRGVGQADLRPGQAVASRSVQAALRLITAFERSPLSGQMELRTIDASTPDVLRAATAQGAEVTLGLEDLETQLLRWRLVCDAGTKMGKAVATLDLSLTNNCPVHWLEATNVPPLKPKPLKPSRLRKKNV